MEGRAESGASKPIRFLTNAGEMSAFGMRAVRCAFVPPYEGRALLSQIEEIGARSVPLISAAGFALGVVLTLHTRDTLVQFGAAALSPTFQAESFIYELGPLVTALLVAGRVGSGIGAELANMRASEQIDAIESMSIDAFKLLVVPRILACIAVLPLLTAFMDFTSLIGGFFSELMTSHTTLPLYLNRAFSDLSWAAFLAPTFKTCVFGFIVGCVSCFHGYTINEGSAGVRRAATNSVVQSSLLIILSDVTLVKLIYFLFPGTAL